MSHLDPRESQQVAKFWFYPQSIILNNDTRTSNVFSSLFLWPLQFGSSIEAGISFGKPGFLSSVFVAAVYPALPD